MERELDGDYSLRRSHKHYPESNDRREPVPRQSLFISKDCLLFFTENIAVAILAVAVLILILILYNIYSICDVQEEKVVNAARQSLELGICAANSVFQGTETVDCAKLSAYLEPSYRRYQTWSCFMGSLNPFNSWKLIFFLLVLLKLSLNAWGDYRKSYDKRKFLGMQKALLKGFANTESNKLKPSDPRLIRIDSEHRPMKPTRDEVIVEEVR